jgi:excisionase family DNA binding protein
MENTTILFQYNPDEFWERMKMLIRAEIEKFLKATPAGSNQFKTPGLTFKPLYNTAELCSMFHVTRPTIYEWINRGKLKPHKISSRVYFLSEDVQRLFRGEE